MTHTCALLKGLICLVSKVTGTEIASGQTSLSSARLTLLSLQQGIAPVWKSSGQASKELLFTRPGTLLLIKLTK